MLKKKMKKTVSKAKMSFSLDFKVNKIKTHFSILKNKMNKTVIIVKLTAY